LIDEVRANPTTVKSSWMESIAISHIPGFEPSDFLASLHASQHFR
jgi:hypothetical protein